MTLHMAWPPRTSKDILLFRTDEANPSGLMGSPWPLQPTLSEAQKTRVARLLCTYLQELAANLRRFSSSGALRSSDGSAGLHSTASAPCAFPHPFSSFTYYHLWSLLVFLEYHCPTLPTDSSTENQLLVHGHREMGRPAAIAAVGHHSSAEERGGEQRCR